MYDVCVFCLYIVHIYISYTYRTCITIRITIRNIFTLCTVAIRITRNLDVSKSYVWYIE